MANTKPAPQNPGMMMVSSFVALFLANSIVVFAANTFFPTKVVLGTLAFSPLWALFHSMFVVSVISTFAMPFFKLYEIKRGKMLTDKDWMVGYFALNLVTVWGVARFSEQFGLGIASWIVAVALALVLDLVQGVIMMQLEKLRPKLS